MLCSVAGLFSLSLPFHPTASQAESGSSILKLKNTRGAIAFFKR